MARRAGMVQRAGRDVRDVVLGVQLDPDGGGAAARARRDLRDLRNGRQVHGRRPLHGRRPARARSSRLRPLHGGDHGASSRSVGLRRGLARRVAAEDRAVRAVDSPLARGTARRAVLASRIAPSRVRANRLPDDARRWLGRRVPEQHVPHLRGARVPEASPRRALESHVDRNLASRAAHRPGSRAHPLVSPLALQRRERDRGRAPDPDLREAFDPTGARPRRDAWCLAVRADVAARARAVRGAPASSGRRLGRAADHRRYRCERVDLLRGSVAVGTTDRPARGRRALSRLRVGPIRRRRRSAGPPDAGRGT